MARSRAPVRTPASSAGSSASRRPFCRTAIANRPSRVPQAAPAAEDRRPAEHDRRDRAQLVAGAGVGLRLAEVRDIDDRRQARRPAPTARRPARPAAHRDPGVARALRREADRVQRRGRSTDRCSRTANAAKTTHEDRQLRRDHAPEIALAEEQEPGREAGVVRPPPA